MSQDHTSARRRPLTLMLLPALLLFVGTFALYLALHIAIAQGIITPRIGVIAQVGKVVLLGSRSSASCIPHARPQCWPDTYMLRVYAGYPARPRRLLSLFNGPLPPSASTAVPATPAAPADP